MFGVYERTDEGGTTTQYVHSPGLLVRLRSAPQRMDTNAPELCDMLRLMGFSKAKGYEKSDELRVWCRRVPSGGRAGPNTGDRDGATAVADDDDTPDPKDEK